MLMSVCLFCRYNWRLCLCWIF